MLHLVQNPASHCYRVARLPARDWGQDMGAIIDGITSGENPKGISYLSKKHHQLYCKMIVFLAIPRGNTFQAVVENEKLEWDSLLKLGRLLVAPGRPIIRPWGLLPLSPLYSERERLPLDRPITWAIRISAWGEESEKY